MDPGFSDRVFEALKGSLIAKFSMNSQMGVGERSEITLDLEVRIDARRSKGVLDAIYGDVTTPLKEQQTEPRAEEHTMRRERCEFLEIENAKESKG